VSDSGSPSSPNLLATRLLKLIRLARKPGLWPVAVRGTMPSLEHEGIPFGHDFRTVIDVGASRGQFAAFAADRFPEASIICFEPLDEPADALERVLGHRVEVHRLALGNEPGTATIHISARDDSSSLLPIGERQVAEFPGTGTAGVAEVSVSTLDDELPSGINRPCLLKIDVQGFEAEVLKGAGRVLAEVDEALIECSFVELYEGQALAPAVVEMMEDAGFVLINGTEFEGLGKTRIQADLHFKRAGGVPTALP
jgi:FkbM family methyltransferase